MRSESCRREMPRKPGDEEDPKVVALLWQIYDRRANEEVGY